MATPLPKTWHKNFDERQLKEIELSRFYAERFNHGTDGHNSKLITARFADMMDQIEEMLTDGAQGGAMVAEQVLNLLPMLVIKKPREESK